MWLLNKCLEHGDQADPQFAFSGAVNWMRGLAILAENNFSHQQLRQFYQKVERRTANEKADALAYQYLIMSIHNVCATESMKTIEPPYPIVRSAIIAWYYATYSAAKAMLAASSDADPQTHAATGKEWQLEIVNKNLAKSPFDLSISNIIPKNVKQEMESLRGENTNHLNTKPEDSKMAQGALYSYLKGTAKYEQWHIEKRVKDGVEYKRGRFKNFRTKDAKALRDKALEKAHVNFLVQAFRYRGKANYRDAIYLSLGTDKAECLRQFVADLGSVGHAFSCMAAHYVSKRVVKADWTQFVTDTKQYSTFKLPFDL